MKTTFTIDGNRICDIPSFYEEINRVFMAGEDWQLSANLDALNDMLHGGFGAIKGGEPIVLIWQNMEKNRADLGLAVTRQFYRDKLQHPAKFNVELITRNLAELENGTGETYFEIVLHIVADHPNIELLAR